MSTSDFNTGEFNWRFYASNIRSNPGQNLILDASGSSNLSMTTNGTERFRVSDSSSVFFTNLDISGNGLRLRGDFSNATASNRLLFQTNVLNGNTVLGVVPNGTSKISQLSLFNTNDTLTSGVLTINMLDLSANITTNNTSGGIPRPLVIGTAGVTAAVIDTSQICNFTNLPTCSVAPSTSNQLVNKSYFDASAGMVFLTRQTFTASSSTTVNNVFSSAYRNYKVLITCSSISTPDTMGIRFRTSGGIDSTTNYQWQLTETNGTTITITDSITTGVNTLARLGYIYSTPGYSSTSVEIFSPNINTEYTQYQCTNISKGATASSYILSNLTTGMYLATTQFIGFEIVSQGGTQTRTGVVSVYGYN